MTKTRSYNRAMPSYEYACLSCGQHVEVYQRFSDEALTVCGVCGGPLRKVFHAAGILFKGSGFYATDSRASQAKASKGTGKDGEPSSAKEKEKEKASSSSSADASSSSGSSD